MHLQLLHLDIILLEKLKTYESIWLDGIGIDWGNIQGSAAGIKSSPQDRENFTLLITALRDVLGDDAWLSVAGTGDSAYIRNSAEINKIAHL